MRPLDCSKTKLAGLWLLLAAIFVHALVPVGSPVFRSAGSAFSASTSDVSLPPSRKLTKEAAARQEEGRSERDGSSPSPPVLVQLADRASIAGMPGPLRQSAGFRHFTLSPAAWASTPPLGARAPPSA